MQNMEDNRPFDEVWPQDAWLFRVHRAGSPHAPFPTEGCVQGRTKEHEIRSLILKSPLPDHRREEELAEELVRECAVLPLDAFHHLLLARIAHGADDDASRLQLPDQWLGKLPARSRDDYLVIGRVFLPPARAVRLVHLGV